MYGDSAASHRRVARLREQSADIRDAADRLVSQAESVPWRGRAADAMRVRIKERARHLRAAAAHHDTAADSLARHVSEVDTRKEAIEAIQHKASELSRDAAARIAALEGADVPSPPDQEDVVLASFTPPPPGHKDWLSIELPGL